MSLVAAGTYEWLAGAIALSPFASLTQIRRDYPPCKKILAARFGPFRPPDYAAANALAWTPRIAPRPAIVAHARQDEVVPFAHAEMIRDRGGATLWEIAEGDHRLQSIDRSSLFKRIRHVVLKGVTERWRQFRRIAMATNLWRCRMNMIDPVLAELAHEAATTRRLLERVVFS